jgi:O-methyltransferase domain
MMRATSVRQDDAALFDVMLGLYAFPALLLAHRFGLFRRLAEGACTLAELGDALSLARRPAEALANVAVALGFARRAAKRFALTPLGADYLIESSPTYWGAMWDLMADHAGNFTLAGLEAALRRDAPRAYDTDDIFSTHERRAELGLRFTRAMHSAGGAHAQAWPTRLDLSAHRVMLDVGGGSGVHLHGALAAWPALRGVLFDLGGVCEIHGEFVDDEVLRARITLHPGDMWTDPYPPADLHFYSNILHDWSPAQGAWLARKSFDALPSGGRIALHEMLLRDDKSGPLAAAGYSVVMIAWTEGEQYTSAALSAMLAEVGFVGIRTVPTCGYYSIVTGVKA